MDAVTVMMRELLTRLGLKRRGLNFYCLRHGFETVGGDTRDQIAVEAIMGHLTPGMGTVYRKRIPDARLQAVVDHVRAWLWPPEDHRAVVPFRKRG